MPHPSPSNADSLKLQSLIQLGRRSGGRPQRSEQFTPGSYLLTVIHTTLAGIEPTTFRLLINTGNLQIVETAAYKFVIWYYLISVQEP